MTLSQNNKLSKRAISILLIVMVLLSSISATKVYAEPDSMSFNMSHGKTYITNVSWSKWSASAGGVAYCLEKGLKFSRNANSFTSKGKIGNDRVRFIMTYGYPTNSASKLADLAGVSKLSKAEAQAATQYALWAVGYGDGKKIDLDDLNTSGAAGKRVLKAAKWLYNESADADEYDLMDFYYYSNGKSAYQMMIYSEGESSQSLSIIKILSNDTAGIVDPDGMKDTDGTVYYGALTDAKFAIYYGSTKAKALANAKDEDSDSRIGKFSVKKGKLSDAISYNEDIEGGSSLSEYFSTKQLERLKENGIDSWDDIVYYLAIDDDDVSGDIETGWYAFDEYKVPTGYEEREIFAVEVEDGEDRVATCYNYPMTSRIDLTKVSNNTDISNDNDCYSLNGAVYDVTGKNAGNSTSDKITTNSSGKGSTTKTLPLGRYVVKESTASKGYAIDETEHPAVLTEKNYKSGESIAVQIVTSEETPKNDPITILMEKIDSELLKGTTQGAASFEGAEYTVRYYDGYFDTVEKAEASNKLTRTWVFKTDSSGYIDIQQESYFVTGDALYYNIDKDITMPLGTFLIQETKTPEGYLIDETVHLRQITDDGGTAETVRTYVSPSSIEQVKRGDLELIKISDTKHERLANVPFMLTSLTTGESHVIVTDDNGYASTNAKWNPHDQYTNRGETSEDGIWFSLNHDDNGTYFDESAPDNEKGAMIYDTYSVEELACDSNKGKELIPAFNVRIYKDSVTVNLGTLTNDEETPPEIGTTAKDKESGSDNVVKDTEVTIVDTVKYGNLIVGKLYTLIGKLMDKATGEPLLIDGKEVTAEVEFTPSETSGSVDVEFTFNASGLENDTDLVVFENLYLDSLEVATHTDINDEGQTVRVIEPEIGTTATGKDGSKEIDANKKATIIDSVKYENLIVGKLYKLIGILMDKATGEPLLIDGKEVTAEVEFTPEKPNGTVEVEFVFDASALAGKEIVVFENLYRDDTLITSHADINDKGQTVKIKDPDEPKSGKSEDGSNSSPKTGDYVPLAAFIIIAILAACAVLILIKTRRKLSTKNAEITDSDSLE